MADRRKPAPKGRAPEPPPARLLDHGIADRLLKLEEVIEIAGIGRTMIYRKVRDGSFPANCRVFGSSSSRWSEREVRNWVQDQLAARAA